MKRLMMVLLPLMAFGCASSKPAMFKWHEKVEMDLQAMGQHNWIVVAQSAESYDTDPAYRMVTSDEKFLNLVKYMLKEIEDAPHVKAVIHRESELDRIQDRDAPGVEAFREKLAKLLNGKEVNVKPSAEIREQLSLAAKNRRVLVVKSEGTVPYGNIYLQLVSGYWDAGREKRLREAIKQAK
jgi:hypothetical protein